MPPSPSNRLKVRFGGKGEEEGDDFLLRLEDVIKEDPTRTSTSTTSESYLSDKQISRIMTTNYDKTVYFHSVNIDLYLDRRSQRRSTNG